jgi:hypothetical protein
MLYVIDVFHNLLYRPVMKAVAIMYVQYCMAILMIGFSGNKELRSSNYPISEPCDRN